MNIPLDEVIYFDCITSTPSTGAAVDADSTPTFAVYEEATDTDIGIGGNLTKRTSLTGNYRGTFTLSSANGFEVGKWYSIIGSAVVGGVTGKAVLKNFRCVAAEAIAGKVKADVDALLGTAWLTPGTAGTPDVNVKLISGDATAADNAEAFFDGTGYAGTNNVIPTVTTVTTATNVTTVNGLAAGVITAASIAADAITDAKVASDVTIASVTGAVGSVTGNVGGNVVGSVASVTGNVGGNVVGTVASVTGAVGSVTGNVGGNVGGNVVGSVASVTAGVTVSAIGANVITASSVATDAVSEIQSGLATSSALTTVAGYLDTEIAAIQAVTTKLDTAMELDGAVYRFTTNALEQGPAGAGGDPWDDALPGAYAAGTAGYILGNLSASTGSGARTVTITVQLSAAAVEGATVRLTKSAETYLGTTNASGVVTFNIDDGTWTVAITAANATYAGTTIVVDGNETATYSMTAISVTPSSAPLRTGYLVCYDEDGVVESGAIVTLTCYYAPDTGYALDSKARSETSDVNGLVQFGNLIVGAKYECYRGDGRLKFRFTVAAGSGSFAITSIVGRD